MWLVPGRKRPGHGAKQFVDPQNDVTAGDILLAAREGFRSVEHVKRYTAMGFGTDQGKLSNINGMGILAQALSQDIKATGTTTFRPNYTPVTFGTVAGRDVGALFDPVRKTALHEWHVAKGALFENVGQWQRPWWSLPQAGEDLHRRGRRECRAVREGVGMLDASTLGKIDVQGPDAAEFLNRVYSNAFLKLEVGRCRYGLLLKEDGMVFDDGVTARLAPDHFLMTTTTGGAATFAWLERWLQTEWPELKVHLTSVTDHWAGSGGRAKSRRAQEGLPRHRLSAEAFPFMAWREGTVAGVPARVFRISFSGELAFEVNVDANLGRHVWEVVRRRRGIRHHALWHRDHARAARREGLHHRRPGHRRLAHPARPRHGRDGQKKGDFGRRSLARSDMLRPDRKQLVGLLTEDPAVVLPEGAQLVDRPGPERPIPMVGHVTSSYQGPALGRSIALAVVKGGLARMGETVHALLADGRAVSAKIARPVFLDPENARMNPPDTAARPTPVSLPEPKAESPLTGLAARLDADQDTLLYERPCLAQIGLRGDAADPAFRAAVASIPASSRRPVPTAGSPTASCGCSGSGRTSGCSRHRGRARTTWPEACAKHSPADTPP